MSDWGSSRASPFFITTEDAEDTENGHFMGNYGVFAVSSASSVVKNILLIIPAVTKNTAAPWGSSINIARKPKSGLNF
jgi:hypothetical protein